MTIFRKATQADALFIAKGFHAAMLMEDVAEERIRLFAEKICSRDDVLYSACNTTIAEIDGCPAGMLTAYDGSRYGEMRRITMELVKEHLGIEFPGMDDETVPGEYYLDSVAVCPQFRGMGTGRQLLENAVAEGRRRGLTVTLAVDPVNTKAQKLYRDIGFKPMGELFIFGHTYWKWGIDRKE
ncbi:MAG: GNAT family N-acetyltransferase [Bacteroidales bacterium]|nr:GNAT family N-acetyltransferase [Bacteroidales bacterium]MCM1146256.1 GNAT family N-acetyltransferase [Bacteroidales bacterium]MCM1205306.1 GNAT family N-acetyltransferase [Bacillota bacterium]MCM1509607.1 GNAT family N-acetyltransferase [Clostridium sp.]